MFFKKLKSVGIGKIKCFVCLIYIWTILSPNCKLSAMNLQDKRLKYFIRVLFVSQVSITKNQVFRIDDQGKMPTNVLYLTILSSIINLQYFPLSITFFTIFNYSFHSTERHYSFDRSISISSLRNEWSFRLSVYKSNNNNNLNLKWFV